MKPSFSECVKKHAMAYGDIVTQSQFGTAPDGTRLTPYTETQCRKCPHDDICCNVIVGSTPFEVLGILGWLKEMSKDFLGTMNSIRFRAAILDEHFKKYEFLPDGQEKAIADWTSKGMKCVFYDHEKKRCGIYPVRPVSCRMAFGRGDCSKDGVKGGLTHPQVTDIRARRIRISKADEPNVGELTALCVYVTDKQLYMSKATQELLEKDPQDLTDWQVIFGSDIPEPKPPKAENSHGSP